jgi:endonuclease/exonuclease/phosphatase family metal-dependent hydrolase
MFSLTVARSLTAAVTLAGVASHVGIATQNVYRGSTPAHVRHDIRDASARASLVFAQEMYGRDARRLRPAGWGSWHTSGGYRGDCAVFWRRDVWRLRRGYVVRLTNADTPRRPSNGRRWAAIAVLTGAETMAGVCVHMPTHAAPRGVYAAGVRRLRALLARLAERFGFVAVGGDWNRHYRHRPAFRGFVSRRPPRATGSGGGRIDYVYVRRPAGIAGIRVIGHTYSDHNGVRVRVRTGRHG